MFSQNRGIIKQHHFLSGSLAVNGSKDVLAFPIYCSCQIAWGFHGIDRSYSMLFQFLLSQKISRTLQDTLYLLPCQKSWSVHFRPQDFPVTMFWRQPHVDSANGHEESYRSIELRPRISRPFKWLVLGNPETDLCHSIRTHSTILKKVHNYHSTSSTLRLFHSSICRWLVDTGKLNSLDF